MTRGTLTSAVPLQPVPACPRLAAAVTLGALRAEDRGAAQVPPQSPLRDGGQPGGREGVGGRTPQRAGTASAPTPGTRTRCPAVTPNTLLCLPFKTHCDVLSRRVACFHTVRSWSPEDTSWPVWDPHRPRCCAQRCFHSHTLGLSGSGSRRAHVEVGASLQCGSALGHRW